MEHLNLNAIRFQCFAQLVQVPTGNQEITDSNGVN